MDKKDVVVKMLSSRFVGPAKNHRQLLHCPFPEQHKHGDRSPSATLNLNTGYVDCWVCGTITPEQILQRYNAETSVGQSVGQSNGTLPNKNLSEILATLPSGAAVAERRGIKPFAANAFELRAGDGVHIPVDAIVIPYIDEQYRVHAIKYRHTTNTGQRYGSVSGSKFDIPFGMHLLDPDYPQGILCITEGELNCVAIWQVAGAWIDCLSVGAQRPSKALLQSLASIAGRYQNVLLWTDEEAIAKEIRTAIASPNITAVTTTTVEGIKYDANEILLCGKLTSVLQSICGVSLDAALLMQRLHEQLYESPYA